MIDFIGVGAQKAGTSWTYACLYEHPEICAPMKEIHFFSRDRFAKGRMWYEGQFKRCAKDTCCGEFSTSYLYSAEAPGRIHELYPHVKIIMILRNPIERAISQYGNALKAGEITEAVSFESYIASEPSVLNQGLYSEQVKRYLKYFDRSQLCVLVYEDSKKDPKKFIQTIYAFLGVDQNFVPSMLGDTINVSRVPKHIFLEKMMHRCAESLRKNGLDRLVYMVRQSGIPERVRALNTKKQKTERLTFDRTALEAYFQEDTKQLSEILGRNMAEEWNIVI